MASRSVGDGAVIGAGTIVAKDVPPYAVVVGNPMQILRYRFPEGIVEELREVAWWDWPLEELHKIEQCFFDVEGFCPSMGRTRKKHSTVSMLDVQLMLAWSGTAIEEDIYEQAFRQKKSLSCL